MENEELYIPIENLEVESRIELGNASIYPSSHVQSIINRLSIITEKTKNTQGEKIKIIDWQEKDLKLHLGKYAFIGIISKISKGDNLIPKDLTSIYEQIKDVIAVLYLLQKQIAGISSIENQKFGLKNELNRSLNFIIALQGNERSSYSLHWKGILGNWTFANREINKFTTNPIYCYFNSLLKKQIKNDIEQRILSSIVWLYDAVMDFSPINRFVKIAISLEVLFTSGKDKKSFRLSRFSTLLSHLFIHNDLKCLCPILDTHTHKEYITKVKKLNLPGICSAYWNIRKWYSIRSNIVHDAQRTVDKKELNSFEWWAHKLIVSVINLVAIEKITNIDDLEIFLERKYRASIKK